MYPFHSLKDIRAALQEGTITCRSLTLDYLSRIEENSDLNAFLEVYRESALQQADVVDKKLQEGKAGKLAGMVIAIKDNICYKGYKVSAASKILQGFESLYNATVVERLLEADAIIIGRLNCDEFAMGSSNENSAYGNVLNSLDKTTVPGGSSGGSAVAVAADLCLLSLGSDTGGSIRQPASFCGIAGLKPTYGRVSRYGLIAYASSFDQIGPFAKDVSDLALVMEVMAGKDEYDSTVSSQPVAEYSSHLEFNGKARIAYLTDCLEAEGLDPEIRQYFDELIGSLKSEGHVVEGVEFPYLDYMVPVYHVLANAEASSNLARFDGMRYGYRSPKAEDMESVYKDSRTEGFGTEVKRRIMLGTFVLSEGYYDAYYSKAQKVRRVIKEKTDEILSEYDFILLPTTPSTAFKIGANTQDPITMYLQDIFTIQANLTGSPAISLPLGKHSNGLPFGVQLIGKHFGEAELLAFSRYLVDAK